MRAFNACTRVLFWIMLHHTKTVCTAFYKNPTEYFGFVNTFSAKKIYKRLIKKYHYIKHEMTSSYIFIPDTKNKTYSFLFSTKNGLLCENVDLNRTRKSKTEAVLQRRSMLKLGVICKFMNRYRKCFMS